MTVITWKGRPVVMMDLAEEEVDEVSMLKITLTDARGDKVSFIVKRGEF